MSQGLFAGFTKYSEQSISDIKEDIIRWRDYSERIKKEFQSTIDNLTETGYWDYVPYDYSSFCEEIPALCNTFLTDFNIVLSAISEDKITPREITLMENIHNVVHQKERELVSAYKGGDTHWHKYGDNDFAQAEALYKHVRDYFVTLFDVDNAAGRMEHYMRDDTIVDNSIRAENSIIVGNSNDISDSNIGIDTEKKSFGKWLAEYWWCPLGATIIGGIVVWLITNG